MKPARFTDPCVILCLGCVVLWNVQRLMPSGYRLPTPVENFCRLAHLNQEWGMFVHPLGSGWFVVPGTLQDGTEVDLLRGGASLNWEKPRLVSASFKNEHWRKYLFRLLGNRGLALDYARYACRSWNADHGGGKRLESLEIVHMSRPRPSADDAGRSPKQVVLSYRCSERSQEHP